MPAPADVVVDKGSKYILAHTEPKELDGHPLLNPGVLSNETGGGGLGVGLVPDHTTLSVRLRANINSVT